MKFTDDDLARVKTGLKCVCREVESPGAVVSFEDIEALIHRLEAAEKLVDKFMCADEGDSVAPELSAWRKAKGEDGR